MERDYHGGCGREGGDVIVEGGGGGDVCDCGHCRVVYVNLTFDSVGGIVTVTFQGSVIIN